MYVNSVGHKLRMLRLERNLTQQEVSKLTGMKVSTIKKLEWNIKPYRQLSLEKLASFYGFDVKELKAPLH